MGGYSSVCVCVRGGGAIATTTSACSHIDCCFPHCARVLPCSVLHSVHSSYNRHSPVLFSTLRTPHTALTCATSSSAPSGGRKEGTPMGMVELSIICLPAGLNICTRGSGTNKHSVSVNDRHDVDDDDGCGHRNTAATKATMDWAAPIALQAARNPSLPHHPSVFPRTTDCNTYASALT